MAWPAIAARIGLRASICAALAIFAISHLLLGLATSPALAAAALFAEALSSMLWNVVTVSYRQRIIPDALLGRVNSIYRFFGWGALPLGALAAGAIVSLSEETLGREMALRVPMLAAAALIGGLAIYAVRYLRMYQATG